MAKKNPWIAAILNLLLPGLGFIYCGTTFFIVGGVLMALSSLSVSSMELSYLSLASILVSTLGGNLAVAILGYGTAEYLNRSIIQPASK